MAPTVFTIGHSSQPVEQLIALLQRHGISQLADVRSAPASRVAPPVNPPAQAPPRGPHPPPPWRARGPPAAAGWRLALRWRHQRSAERDPLHCHRTHLVTPALLKNGAAVMHILSDGGLLPHAALQQPPKQQDLFG